MYNLQDILHDYFSSNPNWKYGDHMEADMTPHFLACMQACIPKFSVGQCIAMSDGVVSVSNGIVSKIHIKEDGYYYDFDYEVPQSDLCDAYRSWKSDVPERQLTEIK